MKKQTKAIDEPFCRKDPYGALSMPVYNSVAYEFDNAQDMADTFCGRMKGPDYSRTENPTVTYFENKVKSLTGAADVVAFNSGMAAISNALMAVVSEGKYIIASRHLFGNTLSLITGTLRRFGVKVILLDLTDAKAVEEAVNKDVCCIFLEIMTNPQLEVADLKALSVIARKHNIPLIADSTTIPFTETDLGGLGVDVEIVSSTKYISGGATSLGGLVIDYGRFDIVSCRLRGELLFNIGAYMTPQVAYMQSLGLETLAVRYNKQAENALWLANELYKLPGVKVNYVGLKDNPYYEISRKQFGETSGAMLTIDLNDRDACFRFLNNLKLIRRATNLFDNRTLAIHPTSTIFGLFTDQQRKEMDVLDTTIRLSVGLEDVEDLLDDIKQAL